MHGEAELVQILIYHVIPEKLFVTGMRIAIIYGVGKDRRVLLCKI